jgi:hypothetical protein
VEKVKVFKSYAWIIICHNCDKMWKSKFWPINAAAAHQKWHLDGGIIDNGEDWEMNEENDNSHLYKLLDVAIRGQELLLHEIVRAIAAFDEDPQTCRQILTKIIHNCDAEDLLQ